MSALLPEKHPLCIAIREIRIAAASSLEARRLADALPAALEHAFAQLPATARRRIAPRQTRIDRVAARIVGAVAEQLEARR